VSDRFRPLRRALGELRGRTLRVVLGCLICQMGLGLTYVSRPLAPFVIEELGLSRTAFSSASVPQLLAQSLLSPAVGYLAVRLGASRVLAFGAAWFTLTFVLFARIESLMGLYIAIAGIGVGAACMGDVAVGHVVSRWTSRSRGLALGIAFAGSNLGGLLVAQLFIHLASHSGWRTALLAIAVVALVVLLPAALLLIREPPADLIFEPASEGDEVSEDLESLDLPAALRTRSFWILSAVLFAFFFYFQGILDHLVLFLIDSGMSRVDATFYFSQAVGLGIVSKLAGGFLADRISHLSLLRIDFGLIAVSSVILLFMPDPALLWVFVFAYGLAAPARDIVYPLMLAHCFGVRYLGKLYGAMMLALPGGALGAIFAASIYDRMGHYDWAFATFAVLNGLAFVALFFIRNERA